MPRIRTGYSFNHSIGKLDDVFNHLKKCNYKSFPITDRNSTYGFQRWNKLCVANKMNPAFGVEIGISQSLDEKKPALNYWTFLAIDDLKPLNDLVSMATANSNKEPFLIYSQIAKIDNLIMISGPLTPNILLRQVFAKNKNHYVALSPSTPRGFYNQVKNIKGIQFVACSDNNYITPDQRETYRMALHYHASVQSYAQHILDDKELRYWLDYVDMKDINSSVRNKNKILKQCTAELKEAQVLVPQKKKTLLQMCKKGAHALKIDLSKEPYKTRLKYELKLIQEKQFDDYFYIVADLVNWAKSRLIVGPARGSSCGSLVCYLLGITAIDPLEYGLIFERFIDINRSDLPDIDIDFSDVNRHKVFEYVEQKYGAERVARLGTVSMFQPKSALKEIGKSLSIPVWECDKVLDFLIEKKEGDADHDQQLKATLEETTLGKRLVKKHPGIMTACEMENHPRNASQHAAGIVITENPINEVVAIDSRTKSTMCDKKDAERLNLLKIDALGLKQLSIFERCLELIGEKPICGYLESLPLDDPAAFDVLNKGHYSGIFQFNGHALQSLGKEIKFTCLNDIVAITALARPGPLATGESHKWVKRKKKFLKSEVNKHIYKFTKETFGIITYQEQVMYIAKELGRLSWADVSDLRKGIGKTLGEEYLSKYKDQFIENAYHINKVPKADANAIWNNMVSFGAYAFNKSHAVAYGVMSYWCCYLKAHHPVEFAAASLDAQNDPMKQILILRELQEEGIEYKPFDLQVSSNRWEIKKEGKKRILVGPLTNIKGVGPSTENDIIESRKTKKPLRPSLIKRLESAKSEIDSLYPVNDAINRLFPDLSEANIKTDPTPMVKVQPGECHEVLVIGVLDRMQTKDVNAPDKVEKRGYKFKGPTKAFNMFFQDDTDELLCRIDRFEYERLARPVMDQAKPKKSIYAVKGLVPHNFRMIDVKRIKYLGEIDEHPTNNDRGE